MRVGINGHLADCIFKSRVLQCYSPKSVDLVITPHCEPLLDFFSGIHSVRSVTVDSASISTDGHGEQTQWSVALDVDTTYPGYPSEWCVNYIAHAVGLPRIARRDWFGSFRYLLGKEVCERSDALFLGPSRSSGAIEAEFRAKHPGQEIVRIDEGVSILENARSAHRCSFRVLDYGVYAALFSALGMKCRLLKDTLGGGHYGDLFRSYGETLVSLESIFTVRSAVPRRDQGEIPVEGWRSTQRVTVCIPTLCCGDLVEEALDVLVPQLEECDSVLVLDNGQQQLAERLPKVGVRVMEAPCNLGVAGSWNRLIKEVLFTESVPNCDWVLMMNDDVAFGADQWPAVKEVLQAAADRGLWFVTGAHGWSIFGINRVCIDKVGWFDEEFFPAYFEDNDYHRRINLVDAQRYWCAGGDLVAETLRTSVTLARNPHVYRFNENRDYYMRKWGGLPGNEQFQVPFNNPARLLGKVD